MAQLRCRGERKHRQPTMNARLPQAQGHAFAAQAVGGPVSIGFDATSEECTRQPAAVVGDSRNGAEMLAATVRSQFVSILAELDE